MIKGCSDATTYESHTFVNDTRPSIAFSGHIKLCNENPNDMFCLDDMSVGDIQPTKEYALYILNEMNSHFTYTSEKEDDWSYNTSIYETLVDDCDSIALTMAHHMIMDGISREYIALASQLWIDGTYHVFVALNTSDAGWLHLDYYGSGVPLERINWHMLMTDPGAYRWIKGDINE
jgi:predicted transglutaminase-like cysteine proteinase